MFKQRKTADTKIETIFQEPKAYISTNAYAKMSNIVDICDKEVGWLGTANWIEENNIILIDDIYLFHQEVNSSTCEITSEGLAKFAEELLQKENGIETWNNIKLWGHSHVNMSVSPSGQDNKQMEVFADHNDWFLRIIANKSGELKLDLYDYKANLSYIDLKWELFIPEMFNTLEFIEGEIKEKVKEKTYSYANGYGYGYNKIEKVKEKSKDEEDKDDICSYYHYISKINIYAVFDKEEIIEIAEAPSLDEAKQTIKEILNSEFTDEQIYDIYTECIAEYMDIIYEVSDEAYEDNENYKDTRKEIS